MFILLKSFTDSLLMVSVLDIKSILDICGRFLRLERANFSSYGNYESFYTLYSSFQVAKDLVDYVLVSAYASRSKIYPADKLRSHFTLD